MAQTVVSPAVDIPTVDTERLILREFRNEDITAVTAMLAEPDVAQFLGHEPADRSEAWRMMATMLGHWALRGYGMWIVELRASGEVVGRVGPWQPEEWPGFEVGWTIAKPHWGNGYAGEAARASIDWARRELGVERIISCIDPVNTRSIAVARKLGAERAGSALLRGKYPVDVYEHPPAAA